MNSQYVRWGVNLLVRDKLVLARMASQEGETMSTVVRRLIRQEAQRLDLTGENMKHQVSTGTEAEAADV